MDDDLFVVDKAGDHVDRSDPRAITKEEDDLSKALFGTLPLNKDDMDVWKLAHSGEEEEEEKSDVVSGKRERVWDDSDDEREVIEFKKIGTRKMKRRPDEDAIEGFEYEQRLREDFEKNNPAPTWAKVVDEDKKDSSSLFASTSSLTTTAPFVLKRDIINVKRVSALNSEARSDCVVENVRFSPTAPIALTAGRDKTLRIFQVSEKKCRKLHSVYFVDLPILWSRFIPKTNDIISLGPRKLFYMYDMESDSFSRVPHLIGQTEQSWKGLEVSPDGLYSVFLGGDSGNVVMYSNKSRQVAHTLKMNGTVDKCTFSPDSRYLWTAGPESEVFQWDLRMNRRCLCRFKDQGGIGVDSIRNSPDGQWQAIGDRSGMVNIYDLKEYSQSPKPVKTIGNLLTGVTKMSWNHDSQLLCISSVKMADSLKLVHVPSFSVFKNWPMDSGFKVKMGHVGDTDFSPHSGYLSVGSNNGTAHLFRMMAYNDY